MVTYKLFSSTGEFITYHYFPNGDETKDFGIITINVVKQTIEVSKLAPDDFESVVTKEEINELRDFINKMRIEDGECALTEEELPIATEDETSRFFADHAVQDISDSFNAGIVKERGCVAWY